jgi:tetratricopeptide (TPR) repeat protein
MTKPKIFVSHSSKDVAFALKLVRDLNAAGAQAWMDSNDLGAGNFQQHIDEALAGCEWLLLVLTRNALSSEWVRQEVYAANRLKNQGQINELIFIKAEEVDHHQLPPMWGVYNIFDATQDYSMALKRVLKEVGLLPASNEPLEVSKSLPTGTYYELITRGSQLIGEKRFSEAIPYFERATQFAKASASEWGNLGFAYNACGRWQEALHAHDMALALNDDLAWVWSNKADALVGLGRYEEAVECYKQGLRISDNWNRRQSLAKVLRMLGRNKEAKDAIEQRQERN